MYLAALTCRMCSCLSQALHEWMEEEAAAGRRGMHSLPVFYLLRGRVAEGLHANARLSRMPPPEGDASLQVDAHKLLMC